MNEYSYSSVIIHTGFYSIADPEHSDTVRCAYCRMEMANLQHDHPPPIIMYFTHTHKISRAHAHTHTHTFAYTHTRHMHVCGRG